MIQCKRVYEPAASDDGYRVLVDRLWPRGIRKTDLIIDEWLKDIAPSTELRKTFGHDPAKFEPFKKAYLAELEAHPEYWQPLLERAKKGTVTLLYAAHDKQHNQAAVLCDFIKKLLKT